MRTLFLCAVLCLPMFAQAGNTFVLSSPSKNVTVNIRDGETLTYDVTLNGKTVLAPSKLGLTFKDQPAFGPMQVQKMTGRDVDETWENRFSKRRIYRDHCKEATIQLVETVGLRRTLTLVVRVYDDGLAFRYMIPEQEHIGDFVLLSDDTQFAFTGDWRCWASDYPSFNSSHENEFPEMKLSGLSEDSHAVCPLVVQGDFGYAALTEAELTRWAGANFAHADGENTLKIRLTPRADGNGCVVRCAPAASPWRVILLGEKPVDLVNNSGIVLNVSAPCVLEDTDWIQTGASSWDWWSEGNIVLNTDTLKERIDLAAEMGWKFTTLDDPWYFNSMFQRKPGLVVDTTRGCGTIALEEAFAYAKSRGIGICLWMHYNDVNYCGREKTFIEYEKWGASGVKIDFMNADDQETVEWIAETTALAAKHRLVVNYHGMYKGTGMERAYPNQITREGILGTEYNKFSTRVTTRHCATLPFTRWLVGPGDFTPGGFLNVQPENFKMQEKLSVPPCMEQGTRAHALAMCLITDSPILTICDAPKHYANQPGLEFLRNIPAVWDETRALDGAVGEYYVVARRSGKTFYASAITNENPREITLKLDFLSPGVTYTAAIYADAPESSEDAAKIQISRQNVTSADTLNLPMVRNGGWNAVFTETD